MDKFKVMAVLLLPAALAGCSGSSGGSMSLSGGSIPTGGGGSIKGLAVLPNAQPLTGATVSVRALATGQAVSGTPVLSTDGSFSITSLPTGQDLEVVLQQTAGPTLKAIVAQAQLSTPSAQPVDIGTVNALTTVVAQSLERETSQNPDQTPQIVSDQLGPLTVSLRNEQQSEDDQSQEIEDGGKLTAAATTLILKAVNNELQALAAAPTAAAAATALHGLVAQIGETRGTPVHLTDQQRSALIAAQLAGKTFSVATLAMDLTGAGATTSADAVTAADQAQRVQLPAWSALGPAISPFEGLAIAASSSQAGGFGLSQASLGQFLTALLPAL